MKSKVNNYNLGPLELEIMECVWERGDSTVLEIHECLGKKREIAYTTVMTVMMRLWQKGFLKRIKDGKNYIYSYKRTKDQAIKNTVSQTLEAVIEKFGIQAVAYFSEEVEKYEKRL